MFRFGKSSGPERNVEKARERAANPFHAVGISPGACACKAALAMMGERFLSAEAPTLPLAACDSAQKCTCRHQHFEDRRHLQRRGDDHWESGRQWIGPERRQSRGRRATDR